MKVALVHDWLTGMRGGEKVLEQLCLLYPQAHIYTLVHYPEKISPIINKLPIKTSFIQKLPGHRRRHQKYLPFFPLAIEHFDLTDYDLVISTSHCVAKGVITRPGSCHISYIHTPMRYAWEMYHQYFGHQQAGLVPRLLAPLLMPRMRLWDGISANRVDYFIANSNHTARRIKKHYRRNSEIVYPPVDTDFFTPENIPRKDYFLIVSALVPYKKIEIAIAVCTQLKLPLVVIGEGVESDYLQAMSSSVVQFKGRQSDEEIRNHYRSCRALLFPGEEDCGLVPLEAQSCGCPVIAYSKGGALETVKEATCGVFFPKQTTSSLIQAIKRFEQMSFDPAVIRKTTLPFGQKIFRRQMKELIEKKFSQYQNGENIPLT